MQKYMKEFYNLTTSNNAFMFILKLKQAYKSNNILLRENKPGFYCFIKHHGCYLLEHHTNKPTTPQEKKKKPATITV
ncbi:hypothetical protein GQX74_008865, partial [Glossina fuscipes]